MEKIRFEETDSRMNLDVGEDRLVSLVKHLPFPPGMAPFQYVLMMCEQPVIAGDGRTQPLWKFWLEQLYEEGKL